MNNTPVPAIPMPTVPPTSGSRTYPYTLPPLPYAYNALEPFIDADTLYYHHDKHFQAYVDNLNAALKPYPALQTLTLEALLLPETPLPPEARTAILNNAGGVYNHTLYFAGIAPASQPGHQPEGVLLHMLQDEFGSVAQFKDAFTKAALGVFGSGWASLVYTPENKLKIVQLANQDTAIPLLATTLLTSDVWEHAYYLKYKNERVTYQNNLWNLLTFPQFHG